MAGYTFLYIDRCDQVAVTQEVADVTFNYADLQRNAILRQLTGDRDRRKATDMDQQRSADRGFDLVDEPHTPPVTAALPDAMALRVTRARERRQAVMLVEAEYRTRATELHADPNQLKVAHDDAIRAVYEAHPL